MIYHLSHHGVKGQKWGTRNGPPYPLRNQYKNGKLTKLGEKRYKKLLEQNKREKAYEESDEYLKKFGLERKNEDYVLKKGSSIERITDRDETVGEKEKYVSVTDDDKSIYREGYDMLGLRNLKEARIQEYETKKDINIASNEKVISKLLEKYGDMKIKDFTNTKDYSSPLMQSYIKQYKNLKVNDLYFDKLSYNKDLKNVSKRDSDLEERYDFARVITNSVALKLSNQEVRKEIIDKFKSEGYDAMFDAEDKINGFTVAPLIVFTPKETMRKTKSTKL